MWWGPEREEEDEGEEDMRDCRGGDCFFPFLMVLGKGPLTPFFNQQLFGVVQGCLSGSSVLAAWLRVKVRFALVFLVVFSYTLMALFPFVSFLVRGGSWFDF